MNYKEKQEHYYNKSQIMINYRDERVGEDQGGTRASGVLLKFCFVPGCDNVVIIIC